MCRIYFELLTETTLKLISIFELDALLGIDVGEFSKSCMGAWSTVLSLAVVGEAQMNEFVVEVNGQKPSTAIA